MVTLSTISFLAGFKDYGVPIKNASSVRRRRNSLSICLFLAKYRLPSGNMSDPVSFRFVSTEIFPS